MSDKTIICLMGPTAAGKTALACELSHKMPVKIISVDSAMVYRGMNIGTGKPTVQELADYPHALIDIVDPTETYNAQKFVHHAREQIEQAYKEDKIPLLVGGTCLYFHALLNGLDMLPASDAHIRSKIFAEAEHIGWHKMHARLSKVDPRAAATIHPNDPQRIGRALEVYTLTGRPITSFYGQYKKKSPHYKAIELAIAPKDRNILHKRIAQRFTKMLSHGLIDEVIALRNTFGVHDALSSQRAVGYRQIWGFLNNRYDFQEMEKCGIIATRQLAKRQMTWLRKLSCLTWYDSVNRDTCSQVYHQVQSSLG